MRPGFTLKAVVYQRVSTDRQAAEGISLEAQEAMARERCAKHGWEVVGTYTDVMSGRSSKRPEFMRLLADAERKAFDVVIVYRTDRLARSTLRLLQTVASFQDRGIALVSLSEDLDLTTAQGRAFFQILASFSELESANTGMRVRDAMRHRAMNGGGAIGLTPDGYRRGEGGLEPDPARAPIIAEAFSSYLAGGSLRATCDALTAAGKLTIKGRPWNAANLRAILTNPVYTGAVVYGKHVVRRTSTGVRKRTRLPESQWIWTKDAHEALVSEETFEQVQARLADRKRVPARRLETLDKSPWAGLLRCGACGYAYDFNSDSWRAAKGRPVTPYYRCSSQGRRGKSVCPDSKAVYEGALVRYALPALDQALRGYLEEASATARPRASRRLKRAPSREQRIASLEAAIVREADIYRAGAQSLEAMSEAVKRLRQEIEALSAPAPEGEPITLEPPRIEGRLVDFWGRLTIQDRAVLLRGLIERIEVYPDRCEAIPVPGYRWCLGERIPFRRSARAPLAIL